MRSFTALLGVLGIAHRGPRHCPVHRQIPRQADPHHGALCAGREHRRHRAHHRREVEGRAGRHGAGREQGRRLGHDRQRRHRPLSARRLQPAGLGQLAGRGARDLRQCALRLAHGLPADQPHPGRARRAGGAAQLADQDAGRLHRPRKGRQVHRGRFRRRHHQPHRHRADRRGDRHQVHAGALQGQRTGPSRPDRGPGAGAGRPGQCRDRPYQGGQDARHRRVVRQARAAAARRADHEGVRA